VNHHLMNHDFDVDDRVPMGEIEYEESDGVDTAVEVALLLARLRATRCSDA
jgi:hypothetical protein